MPTRVMLVDDAVVVRHILTDTLSKDPALQIVGTASDGKIALEKIPEFNPDVVVLDVEMPNMDGIETLAAIKKLHPRIKVIMFSTLTSRGAAATMDALMSGADDYVCKPANVGSINAAIESINAELVPKIKALHKGAPGATTPPPSAATRFGGIAPAPSPSQQSSPHQSSLHQMGTPAGATATPAGVSGAKPAGRLGIIAIAVSTGGPNALAALLPQLPANLPVPIVIVQHIPPMFSKALAERLDAKCALRVQEGMPGSVVQAGEIWIAPGDFHMTVQREGPLVKLATNQGPHENSCRPAADVLFRSVAAVYGADALGIILTGMGNDGLKGSQEFIRVGSRVIAQDEASSVVWGMPGAVVGAGLAERVLPLDKIAAEIIARTGANHSPSTMVPR